ncbi:MAG: GntR family transcriptional regulator, partial [Pseudomonadota bacterium]
MKLSQVAYRQFKELLLTGRIKSGSVMSQADLVELVGVPISPLREALQVLEAEGLLSVEPRSGIHIVKPDLELIKNAYQLRRMIEREAVIKFTSTCQSAELDDWERRHIEFRDAVEKGLDQPKLGERVDAVDRAFHNVVVQSLRNPLIEETYQKNMERLVVIRLDRAESLTPLLVKLSMDEHLNVIAAMKRHDPEAAAAAMDEHLTITMHRAM